MPANSAAARSRSALVLSGYAILALSFILVGVFPFLRQRSTINAGISALQRDIADRQANKHKLDELQKQVYITTLLTKDYPQLVSPTQDLSAFFQNLSAELDRAGIKDTTNRTLPVNNLGKTQKLPIEIHGKATYPQFQAFLKAVENLNRKSSVGRLTIDADNEISGTVEFQVTLYIYNTKPDSAP